jgi:DNA (cytosine-5)-methyltransferase 1
MENEPIMKVLNLYAGIGGNRKLWKDVEVTAVEINPEIAAIYQDFFPDDEVIVADAHQYLLDHYKEFDFGGFIWSSPPCPTHSRLRTLQKKQVFPDMKLYEEIIFLQHFAKGFWVVENVLPYYDFLIKPQILHRHAFWNNFKLHYAEFPKLETCKAKEERKLLQQVTGFNLDKYSGLDKRKLLRNAVLPELGLHILNCAREITEPIQEGLFANG